MIAIPFLPLITFFSSAVVPQSTARLEPNQGQFRPSVRFAARTPAKTVLIADCGMEWLDGANAMHLRLGGDCRAIRWEVSQPLKSTSHYFIGNDRSRWRSGVPNFSRVTAHSVFPGVDIAYYGKGADVEYDFIVTPGADPSKIHFSLSGHRSLRIDPAGNLIVQGATGEVRHHRPVAYQIAGQERRPVDASYRLQRGRISFTLGTYDRSLPLIIDPLITYSTYAGGDATDYGYGMVLDPQGNLYVAGASESANYPSTPGAYQPAPKSGPRDAVIMKYDPAGRLLFSTYLGGTQADTAYAIALDINGNIYVGGGTDSNDLPVTDAAYQKVKKSNEDGWLAKLPPSGSSLIWLTYLGGASSVFRTLGDYIAAIAVDANGSAFVTGQTCAIDFPTTPGAVRTPSLGLCDIFVVRFTPNGSSLAYSSVFGGTYPDSGQSIALDADGNVYVSGWIWSEDVPATPGVFQRAFAGGLTDVFVAKINPSGTAFVYLTYLGGSENEFAYDLAVDRAGNAYVTGYTTSDNYPATPGAYQTNFNGKSDGFVTKINPTASAIVYSAYVGRSGDETVRGIAVDARGNAYLTGETDSASFPTTPGAIQSQKAAALDAFLIRLDPDGRTAVYSTLIGGNGVDIARRILLDAQGNAVILGNTDSSNFPVSANAPQGVWKGSADTFITKVDFVAGIPAAVAVESGNNQRAPVGQPLPSPLTVIVRDGRGNPVASVPVTFAGTNATVTPTSATTDATGRASSRATLGNTIGPSSVTASVAGLPPVTFSATADPFVPPVVITRVVNGGSFNENLAAGAYVTFFGANLAGVTAQASTVPLPLTIGGTQVLVNGKAVPLLYVSPSQINAQLPYDVGVGLASAVVSTGSQQSAPSSFVVIPAAPGILQYGAGRAVAQNQDYSLNTAEAPALVDSYITVYMTGIGQLDNPLAAGTATPDSPLAKPLLGSSATIGGKAALLAFIGMTPGFVGLAQANIQVPDLPTGEHNIVITVGTVPSNPAKINVSAPPAPQ